MEVEPTKSCDEYPFAATSEGGGSSTIAWVPKLEQDNQGALLGGFGGFYEEFHVVDGDQFKVAV